MEKILIVAFIIAILFGLGKFLVAKFVEKEMPPLKYIVRDIALAGCASLVGLFAVSKLDSIWSTAAILPGSIAAPQIFTDEPGF
jgi:cation transporter-like permease